jgi:hypothetical protein
VVLFGAEVASKTGLARVMRNSAMKMVWSCDDDDVFCSVCMCCLMRIFWTGCVVFLARHMMVNDSPGSSWWGAVVNHGTRPWWHDRPHCRVCRCDIGLFAEGLVWQTW